ncbi:hypothetical protein C8R45DRAFT_38936 [Mycena sanguinolenta]|nr:hypothetical protein C8R45DRAFT_38936 [Mycena sanguinolenta]
MVLESGIHPASVYRYTPPQAPTLRALTWPWRTTRPRRVLVVGRLPRRPRRRKIILPFRRTCCDTCSRISSAHAEKLACDENYKHTCGGNNTVAVIPSNFPSLTRIFYPHDIIDNPALQPFIPPFDDILDEITIESIFASQAPQPRLSRARPRSPSRRSRARYGLRKTAQIGRKPRALTWRWPWTVAQPRCRGVPPICFP